MSIAPTSFSKSGSSYGAWFSITNKVDLYATITTNRSNTELPVANLTSRNADTIYRATEILSGDSTIQLDFDFGESVTLDVLSFMTTRSSDPLLGDQGSTLSGSDTVRHQLSTVSAGGTDVYDSGTISHGMAAGHGVHCHLLPQTYSAQYWRMTIVADSLVETSPGGDMDFTRAWAGEVFSFDINADYGAEYYWDSNSTVIKSERGAAEFVDTGENFRVVTLTFSGISNSEFTYIQDFDRITSGQQQFLFGLQKTTLGRYALLVRNSPTGGITYSSPNRFRKRMRLIESL